MITERKLRSLKPAARLRKIAALLHGCERLLLTGTAVDAGEVGVAFAVLRDGTGLSAPVHARVVDLADRVSGGAGAEELARACNTVRHLLLSELGMSPADWDLERGIGTDRRRATVGPSAGRMNVYLEDLRSPFNVGSIFRSAESFGADRIILSPDTPSPEHARARRSAMGCADLVAWETAPLCAVARERSVFALELGGTPMPDFLFPREGCVVVGNEELGVSREALDLAARSGGRVTIPTSGVKESLNVGVALALLLYAWRRALDTGRGLRSGQNGEL